MPSEPNHSEKEWRAVQNAFAEAIANSSDKEVLALAREEGEDPNAIADQVRQTLKRAVKSYQQRGLREAQAQYHRRMTEMSAIQYVLPATLQERRELLLAVFAQVPEMKSALLTAQHREFSSLTDADVDSYLKQLAELGVLAKLTDSSDGKV